MLIADQKNTDLLHSVYKEYEPTAPRPFRRSVSIEFRTPGNAYKLTRYPDEYLHHFQDKMVPVSMDPTYYLNVRGADIFISGNLAKTYTALRMIFGESSIPYHRWKGSFAYPFLLSFQKDGERFLYSFFVFNYNGYLDSGLGKLFPRDFPERTSSYRDPFDELPASEINSIQDYFVGYISGYFAAFSPWYRRSFIRKQMDSRNLFGCCEGEFFEYEAQSTAAFSKISEKYTRMVEKSAKNNPFQDIDVFSVGIGSQSELSRRDEQEIYNGLTSEQVSILENLRDGFRNGDRMGEKLGDWLVAYRIKRRVEAEEERKSKGMDPLDEIIELIKQLPADVQRREEQTEQEAIEDRSEG